jgi:hypothetical protein
MDFPPEIICMVKSSLPKQDLFHVELTCRYLYWSSVSNKEWQLRKCQLWNQSPSKIISDFLSFQNYCSHVLCWKYRCQYLSLDDVRSNNNRALRVLRVAAFYGHLPVVQYLCENFQLTIQDVRTWNNGALRLAASRGHLPVVQYLCEKFQLTIQDIRSGNNYVLRCAAFNGHLPVVQYLCETFSLTIQDVRSWNNYALRWASFNGHLAVVRYLCETFELSIHEIRWVVYCCDHIHVVQYLRQKFSIDE